MSEVLHHSQNATQDPPTLKTRAQSHEDFPSVLVPQGIRG